MHSPDQDFVEAPSSADPHAHIPLSESERGEEIRREAIVHALVAELPRPMAPAPSRAVCEDAHVPSRVYAPASERVPVEPPPYDADVIESGLHHTVTAEAALHPGDRSDPAELR